MPKLNFLVRASICGLLIFLPLQSMDQWFYDRFFRLRGPEKQPTTVVLVRVNDAKLYPLYLQKDKRFAPEYYFDSEPHAIWYEDFYNTLLRKIRADEPRLVIFTGFYEGLDKHRAGHQDDSNVIFSGILNDENKLIPPSAHLTGDKDYGFNNIFPDLDNVVRRSHLVYSSGSSLALRTYHRLNQEPIKRNLLDPLWIDFRGPEGSYPNYDAWDIYEGPAAPGHFKGAIVLIGPESTPSADLETPYGRMSRLEIQANTIETFLRRTDIRILPRWATLIIAGFSVVVAVTIIMYFPLTLSWLFLLLSSLLLILITLFIFSQFKVWIGIANPIFCIFGTHLLMVGFKLGRQEEQQWKNQQETEYLREMDQFKNNFISLFSHDLKTPIAKIKAVTDRVLTTEHSLSPDVRDALKTIDRTNSELARFISDILKVTKMESMSLEPVKDVIDLNRLVENSAGRLKFLADEKNISIVLDLEPLFSMEGDQNLIQEVVTNLLENAIKYSDTQRRVIVRTREEENRVRVSVIDEGQGIAPDEIPRVTGKFYRGRATADKVKGSGLGLYLAKYFVELHQGRLEIKSELGKGTEVSFWLPLAA